MLLSSQVSVLVFSNRGAVLFRLGSLLHWFLCSSVSLNVLSFHILVFSLDFAFLDMFLGWFLWVLLFFGADMSNSSGNVCSNSWWHIDFNSFC